MNKFGRKDFGGWIILKEKLHNAERIFNITEGDIWWCAVGENVGVEICGKGKTFARPVLVVRKFDRNSFFGVPLTSKNKRGSWYAGFHFQDKLQTAVLAQAETISARRLYRKIGSVPNSDLDLVRLRLGKLLLKNNP